MNKQQKIFFAVFGGILILAIVIISITMTTSDDAPFVIKNTTNADYNDKLKTYSSENSNSAPNHAVFSEADSILDANGVMQPNPRKEAENLQQEQNKRLIQEMNSNFEAAQTQLANVYQSQEPEEEKIRYYQAQGRRTNYAASAATAKTEQATPSIEPEEQMSDKQRRKQAIESKFIQPGDNIIQCVIHTTQEAKNGDRVKLRTTKELVRDNLRIPVNTILYATLTFSENRVQLNISTIKYEGSFYNLSMSGLGDDGEFGLPLQRNTAVNEVKKETGENIINEATNLLNNIGTGGRIIQSLVRTANRAGQTAKEQKIKLIDRQKINFIINE